jgi:hypothetical protein
MVLVFNTYRFLCAFRRRLKTSPSKRPAHHLGLLAFGLVLDINHLCLLFALAVSAASVALTMSFAVFRFVDAL